MRLLIERGGEDWVTIVVQGLIERAVSRSANHLGGHTAPSPALITSPRLAHFTPVL